MALRNPTRHKWYNWDAMIFRRRGFQDRKKRASQIFKKQSGNIMNHHQHHHHQHHHHQHENHQHPQSTIHIRFLFCLPRGMVFPAGFKVFGQDDVTIVAHSLHAWRIASPTHGRIVICFNMGSMGHMAYICMICMHIYIYIYTWGVYIYIDGMAYIGWYICCISWSKQVCCLRILKASPILLADLTLDTVQTVGLVLEA